MTRFAPLVLLPLAVVLVAAGTVSADSEDRLVVIGHSNPAGTHDLNLHPESQRWAFPSYIAERLNATYSAPELVDGYGNISVGGRGVTFPDLRTILLFRLPPEVPLPGFRESPYFGVLELRTIENARKQRPEEFHTNLAVPGATVSGALTGVEANERVTLQHELLNGTPYFGLPVNPPLASQVDIAVFLKPKWILIGLGGNDVSSLVDPASFETDYRAMVGRLRNASPDALIVCGNVPNSTNLSPGNVTASEVDGLLGLPPGAAAFLYFQATGIFPGPADLFLLRDFALFLLGDDPPYRVTWEEQILREANKNAYNDAIRRITKEFGAVYVDAEEWALGLASEGLEVSIDGTEYLLTYDYGGGLFAFDGGHLNKTAHAAQANKIIGTINAKTGLKLPRVDVHAVACTDLHVRRALGLPESGFDCPPPKE